MERVDGGVESAETRPAWAARAAMFFGPVKFNTPKTDHMFLAIATSVISVSKASELAISKTTLKIIDNIHEQSCGILSSSFKMQVTKIKQHIFN